jgi:DNA-binding transcriptional regulator YdaS (Cro superfamily)
MNLRAYLDEKRGRCVWLAKKIGAHPSDVSAWASGARPVPIPFGWPIERDTGGQVTRVELFPLDAIANVWPDLIQQKGRPRDGS